MSQFSGQNTASDDASCYARALELIVEDYQFEPLRRYSQPLAEWLIEIGHPERWKFEALHHDAAMTVFMEESARETAKRETKWDKFQQSKRVIKKSKEDIEDDRLMAQVVARKAHALDELRKRHDGRVKKAVREITRSNSSTDDITQKVFIQVWNAAPTYVPAAKLTTWLIKIAKNLALNEKNRAKKEKERVTFADVSEHGNKGRRTKNLIGDSAEFGRSAEFSSSRGEGSSMGEEDEESSELPYIGADDGPEADADGSGSQAEVALQALNQLSPSERRVIEARFGIGGSKRKDRQSLADELGVTAGKVEDLERTALSKMRGIISS